jgi:hypothetical protein
MKFTVTRLAFRAERITITGRLNDEWAVCVPLDN